MHISLVDLYIDLFYKQTNLQLALKCNEKSLLRMLAYRAVGVYQIHLMYH